MTNLEEYYFIEWDLPEVAGVCTIGGQPGYGTPVTCTDQPDGAITTKTYKFTDTALVLAESDIYKCVKNVTETTVELKGGTGLGTRATVSVTFDDFINIDPNPESPALVATPSIKNNGTFFGKLDQRNYLTNKPFRVIRVGINPDTKIEVYRETNAYLSQEFKRNKNGQWTMTGKDAMYRADQSKSQYPEPLTGRLTSAVTDSDTSITFAGDVADWDETNNLAIIGEDLMLITSPPSGSSTSVTLTVSRLSTITLGVTNPRTINNTPEEHDVGDEVYRGKLFQDVQIVDLLVDIFTEMGLDSSLWDEAAIDDELQAWIASPAISAIYYESNDTVEVLNSLCSTYLIDVWFDTRVVSGFPDGQVKVKATSPWAETVKTLTEGVNFNYNSLSTNQPEQKQFSRCFLQYNKRNLVANDDDVNFLSSSLGIDSEVESDRFAGEVTVKRLAKSTILGGSNDDIAVADLTTSRFVRRFSQKPGVNLLDGTSGTIDGIELGDVINVLSESIINFDGTPRQENRAQVINITPKRDSVAGINYMVKTLTYDPFAGAITGDPIPVVNDSNVNLFVEANGPVNEGEEFTFIFDGNQMFQGDLGQTVTTGTWPDNSTINIVMLGTTQTADFRAAGGNGGKGQGADGPAEQGADGGIVLLSESDNVGLTLNIYLSGNRTVQGENYTCDGKLIAPGAAGGGAGTTDTTPGFDGGQGGSGGAGRPFGLSGIGGVGTGEGGDGLNGSNGTLDTGGDSTDGGDGGDNGENGQAGVNSDGTGAAGGTAGAAISFSAGTTVEVFGATIGVNYIKGSGDTPNFNP